MNPIEVSVIMGSRSDLPVMNAAVEVLKEFGIAHEVSIVSAHRTPERMVDYAKSAPAMMILRPRAAADLA